MAAELTRQFVLLAQQVEHSAWSGGADDADALAARLVYLADLASTGQTATFG